ncbi:DUF1631 family protein [Aliikangiella coralliicola]|uniref:DUF1631 domain-containing protein n=1 Tax=Aliikangiella coralliicola TaxID=2592383 RepID=A0A545TW39_9GAMM|nr:DUF1631 family protein [Aliikangiella coralliicola]TQV81414.1 DUF1631 domain-containing protein [Aliikangiella coralliicola]
MSRKLRTLLKQNRNLEEKIFYEPRETDWREELITSQELSDALSCLSSQIIESQSDELCVLRMLNDVKNITGRPLPTYEKNALQVVEILFNYLREHSNFDPKYYHILNSLQLAFTRLSLNDLSYLDNPKHVAVKFLEKLTTLGYHFDKDAGKLAQYFIHAIELLIDRLANRDHVTNQTFMMADQKLDEYFEGFNDKAAANVNKILADIEKQSREAQANEYTEQLIKSKTQGDEMPIFLLDFFENHVSPILYDTIAEHGVQSKQTQQLLTDIDTLTWSITCPFGDPDYNKRFEADVSDMMKRIYQLFEKYNKVNNYIQDFFIETEDLHARKLNGQRVNYDVMISADIFADEEYESNDIDSWYQPPQDSTFFDLESLEEGKWYHLTHEGEEIRSKLLLINGLSKELYFVNLSGELVVKVSFDDTDYLSQNLKPTQIDEQIRYQHATKALVRELTCRLDILKNEYRILLDRRARDLEEQKKQEEEARIAVQRQIAEDRRQQILKRQEEIKLEAERQAEQRRLEELDAKQRFHIKGIYRKLKPGAVIAYKCESGKWKEASLTLISKTTQRHIFSDNKGDKVLEPTKQEVLELIEKQHLKVLKQADNGPDPLQSLVKERRQKLSQM